MLNLMNRSSVNVMVSSSMNDLVKAYIYAIQKYGIDLRNNRREDFDCGNYRR